MISPVWGHGWHLPRMVLVMVRRRWVSVTTAMVSIRVRVIVMSPAPWHGPTVPIVGLSIWSSGGVLVAPLWLLDLLDLFPGCSASVTTFATLGCFISLLVEASVIAPLCVTSGVVLVAGAFAFHDSMLLLSVDLGKGLASVVMATDFFYHFACLRKMSW